MAHKKSIYNNQSGAAIRRMIGFLKSKGYKYNAQKFDVLQVEFERLTGLKKPHDLKFRAWMCYLYNTGSPFLPKTKRFKKNKKKKVDKVKGKEAYHAYLRSKEWELFRQKAFDFYGRECKQCGSKHLLQVHHETYKNIFKEQLSDVTILCESCHEAVHGRKFVYS
jgi:hypothetical protein